MKHVKALSRSQVQSAQILVPDSIKIDIVIAILQALEIPVAAKEAAMTEGR